MRGRRGWHGSVRRLICMQIRRRGCRLLQSEAAVMAGVAMLVVVARHQNLLPAAAKQVTEKGHPVALRPAQVSVPTKEL